VGLILDSSVAIAAERRGDTVQPFLQHVIDAAGDQDAALSAIGVVELVHGIHRAVTGLDPIRWTVELRGLSHLSFECGGAYSTRG
jgi:hypothetical protein